MADEAPTYLTKTLWMSDICNKCDTLQPIFIIVSSSVGPSFLLLVCRSVDLPDIDLPMPIGDRSW